jgi:hypothetical protein
VKRVPAKRLLAIAVSAALPGTAAAVEYMFDAGTRVEYSDNILLTPTNEEQGSVGIVSTGFSMREDGPRLTANLAASVEYQDYRSDQFEDRTNFGFNGTGVWSILPEQLTWTVENVFTQVVRDRALVNIPSNQEDANTFSTGPDVYLRLNPVHTLSVGARYADYYFENIDTGTGPTGDRDSTRVSGIARWLYRYTPRTTLGLNYSSERTDFDDPVFNENFRRRDAYFSLQTRTSQTGSGMNLDLGATTIERERSPEVRGVLGRVSAYRQSTPRSSYRLAASAEYTDSARDLFAAELSGGDPSLVSTPGQTDILFVRQVDVSYSGVSGFLGTALRVYGRSEEYELVVVNDVNIAGGDIELSYKFTESLTGSLTGDVSVANYQTVDRTDTLGSVSLGLAYRAREPLTVNLTLARNERASDGAFAGPEYVELRAVLGVSYRYQTPGSRNWE